MDESDDDLRFEPNEETTTRMDIDEEEDDSVELTDDWLTRVLPGKEDGSQYTVQIIDVQVVDSLPHSFNTSSDMLKGEEFLLQTNEFEAWTRTPVCTVLLFGCTDKGASFLARVTNFHPHLYFQTSLSDATFRTKLAEYVGVSPSALKFKRVMRRNMYGWIPDTMDHPTTRKQHPYIQVFFPNVGTMRRGSRFSYQSRCHEDKVTADTKFMDDNDLVPSGWVTVKGVMCTDKISHCKVELECRAGEMKPSERVDIAPMMVAYVDIECVSDTMGFPDATKPKDEILQIGVNYWRVGTPKESTVKVLYVTPEHCGPVDGAYVMRYASESAMLRGFRSSCMVDVDPDVIATYNGFGFDLPYLWKRAELLGINDFFYCDRIIARKCPAASKELSSSALGQNDLFVIDMYGRTNLDLFHWIKAREKLDSYKLDAVGEHFLGEKKLDMDYKQLFKMARGTPKEVARVGLYCLQDCYLLVLLTIRLQIFAANVEMSRQCHTPMEMLVTRGQQIKVINQLVWYGHRMERRTDGDGGYVMNTPERFSGTEDDTYMGATVIDAKAKYYKEPIATLDFMSLYPSIILANNFCFSTLVQDPAYCNIPGVEYVTITVDHKTYVWAKGMPGVIPKMMRGLLGARKSAKKMMAAAGKRIEELNAEISTLDETSDKLAGLKHELMKAEIEKAVYNARQLALKISANSIYGFTGAVKTGKYHCLAVADSVTYRAREMLHRTVELVLQYTDNTCEVVYGDTDSVMVKFKDTHTAQESADVAEKAADWITGQFERETGTTDIVLEFEKVYWPYLLMRKKQYAGLMWEPNKKNEMVVTKLDAKGIELVRRDNCALAKRIQQKTLDALMYKRDPELACREIESELKRVVDDEVPVMDYKISKSRRKTYANEELPHLKVCEKMAKRQPGSEPQVGDRVPYVLLQVKNRPKAKTFEKAEDIGYVLRNRSECNIDRLYYVEHQIENSICGLMEHVIEDPQKLFKWCKQTLSLQQSNQRTLFSMLGGVTPSEQSSPPALQMSSSSAVQEKSKVSNLEDMMFNVRPTTKKMKHTRPTK